MRLGLPTTLTTLVLTLTLAPGCIIIGADDAADDGAGEGAATGGRDTDGPGATSVYSSGQAPCGTAGCYDSGWSDPCGTAGCWTDGAWTSGSWTSGVATDGASDGASGGNDDSTPLITTGNENAIEWDVTVTHTIDGEAPEEGTYLATTLVHMETDFYSVVEVPVGLGSFIYVYVDGDHAAGVVTNLTGGFSPVEVDGTIQITESTLDGSGTLHDETTHDQVGTWEILDAVPRP